MREKGRCSTRERSVGSGRGGCTKKGSKKLGMGRRRKGGETGSRQGEWGGDKRGSRIIRTGTDR